MRRILLLSAILMAGTAVSAQEGTTYLLMEMMEIKDGMGQQYLEVEEFWSGIHQQRAEAGDILGWDLWSMEPSGTEQGFPYMTVTLYKDMESMMAGMTWDQIMAYAKKAHPDMTDEELAAMGDKTGESRDLAVRIFAVELDHAGEFNVGLGTIATMAWMKSDHAEYEEMESEVFKPMHEAKIAAGKSMGWSFINFILPTGSERYASHLAVNFYEDMNQFINDGWSTSGMSMAEQIGVETALETRELKSVSLAEVIMSIR